MGTVLKKSVKSCSPQALSVQERGKDIVVNWSNIDSLAVLMSRQQAMDLHTKLSAVLGMSYATGRSEDYEEEEEDNG